MTLVTRRWILGVGTALLVGGWGATSYADLQQQAYNVGARGFVWHGDLLVDMPASKTIFGSGVVAMAIGAGLSGFAIPRPRDRSDGGGD